MTKPSEKQYRTPDSIRELTDARESIPFAFLVVRYTGGKDPDAGQQPGTGRADSAGSLPGSDAYTGSGTKTWQILAANRRFLELCGYSSEEELLAATGGSYENLIVPDDRSIVFGRTRRTEKARTDGSEDAETDPTEGMYYRILSRTGAFLHIYDNKILLHDPVCGEVYTHYISASDQRNNQNIYDPLTGLHRKEYLLTWVTDQLRYNPEQFSKLHWNVIYFNIAGFRTINDEFGYSEGDRLLQDVADLLAANFPRELLYRTYGDHFVAFYGGEDAEKKISDVHAGALKLRQDYRVWLQAGIYIPANGRTAGQQGSAEKETAPQKAEQQSAAGTAKKDAASGLAEPLVAIDYAKAALEVIKNDARDYISCYTEELTQRESRKQYIVSHIDKAIRQGWLVLYYQPVVRTLSGKVCSVEALARWKDPEYGMISPGEFVPALEEKNLSYKLAQFVIEETTQTLCRALREDRHPVPVSINLSRKDFAAFDPFALLEKNVKKYGIPRKLICVEITESTAMENPEVIRDVIAKFHKAGYEVWMDDFGSAYSSLNALKDFDFDEIKLDMAFMRNLNDKSRKIIISCINMAKDLGIHTLCEGVETEDQVNFLRDHGCEKIQGYYYSKPVPLSELKQLFDTGKLKKESRAEILLYDTVGNYKAHPDEAVVSFLYRDGRLFPLLLSKKLRDILKEYGITPEELLAMQTSPSGKPAEFLRKIYGLIGQSVTTGKTESLNYFVNGRYLYLEASPLAKTHAGTIYMIRIRDVTAAASQLMIGSADTVVKSMLSGYDGIYRIRPKEEKLQVVLSNFARESIGMSFRYDTQMMVGKVFWKDQERFAAWISREHIERFLHDHTKRSCTGIFRIKAMGSGTYRWESFMLIRVTGSEDEEALLLLKPSVYADDESAAETAALVLDSTLSGDDGDQAVKTSAGSGTRERGAEEEKASPDASRAETPTVSGGENPAEAPAAGDRSTCAAGSGAQDPEESVLTRDSLWRSLENSRGIMLFWKDRNRRFVGASRAFLAWHGLLSVRPILGKTEEEVGWSLDRTQLRTDEEKILRDGTPHARIRTRSVVKGTMHDILVSLFPVYQKGRIEGLIGMIQDAEEDARCAGMSASGGTDIGNLIPGKSLTGQGVLQKQLLRQDPDTGLPGFYSWLEVTAAMEDVYHEEGEDYRIAVLAMQNYWTVYHDLGRGVAEQMAREVIHTLQTKLGIGNVLTRADRSAFVIVSTNSAAELEKKLRSAAAGLAVERKIGSYQTGIHVHTGIASRSEVTNLFQACVLASERCAALTEAGNYPPAGRLSYRDTAEEQEENRISAEELQSFARVWRHFFNAVRAVDPTSNEILWLKSDGTFERTGEYRQPVQDPSGRGDLLGRALRDRSSISRFETDGEELYLIVAQYLEVDGTPVVVELTKLIGDEGDPAGDERDVFITALSRCRSRLYEDSVTGCCNRRYYDEVMSGKRADCVAIIDIDDFKEINDTYGHLAGDKAIRVVAKAIGSKVRRHDLARYGGDEFLLAFTHMGRDTFKERLCQIRDAVHGLAIKQYPGLSLSVSIGGCCGNGVVSAGMVVADKALYQAKRQKNTVCILEPEKTQEPGPEADGR